MGFRAWDLGCRVIMANELEKNIEHEKEATLYSIIQGLHLSFQKSGDPTIDTKIL